MIFDVLENADRYVALHQGFSKAFAFLRRPDLHALPEDRYVIDGDRLYAMVARDEGRVREGAQLEAHGRYIDIQLVLGGTDTMGWKARSSCCRPAGAYDTETDEQLFDDEPDLWLPTTPGAFVVFFPEDAHMPLIGAGPLHKVVVKILVDQR